MPICNNCKYEFPLEEVSGAAGITENGIYIGDCPMCGYWHRSNVELPKSKFTDNEIERLVIGLELSGDNLCRRVFDKLYERGWIPHGRCN